MKTKTKSIIKQPVLRTGGKWEIIAENKTSPNHKYSVISVVPGRGCVSICEVLAQKWEKGKVKHDPESLRNAQLISAAPALLAVAEKFLAVYRDLSESNPGFLAKLTLNDYARFNEVLIELPVAIKRATK